MSGFIRRYSIQLDYREINSLLQFPDKPETQAQKNSLNIRGSFEIRKTAFQPYSLISLVVPLVAEHVIESRYLALATLSGRRFFEVAVTTHVLDNAFAV
jgi:hypothetical protein